MKPFLRGGKSARQLCWLLLAALLPALAQAAEYRIGPAPAWLTPVTPDLDAKVPEAQLSGGVYYLLNDMQMRVDGAEVVRHLHYASKAVAATGVPTVAQVEVDFDPSYQVLTLHSVDVLRAGRRIAKLPGATVRVIQREQELEYRIYDGRKTATLFLDDVRVGDVVEYAYSIAGANPVFDGAIFGGSAMQWGVPVRRDHTRLLVPAERKLVVGSRNGAPAPETRRLGRFREYVWNQLDVAPLVSEDDAPGWHDPYGAVQWSEFADWADVVRWALPLYRVPAELPATVEAAAARIEREAATPEDRVLAALRFVQSEIRYLGVEVGAGSFAPNPPALVMERRFGDCKDKTLLLVTLLQRLGIDAHPALVNTDFGRGILDLLPNPAAFDHVLVRARLGDQVHWLDPTRDTQHGRLAQLHQPDFGQALVVDAGSHGLVPMTVPGRPAPKREVELVLDSRRGMDAPVRMTVTTTDRGGGAERMRRQFASSRHEQLLKDYLNFYASYYPGIRSTAPLEVSDDQEANVFRMVEHYEVDGFWAKPDADGVRAATIQAADVRDLLRDPPSTIRHAPLARVFPLDVTHTTEVLLHEAWSSDAANVAVDDPAFSFSRDYALDDGGKRILITDNYVAKSDHVPVDRVAAFAANLERAQDGIGYELTWAGGTAADAGPGGFNWPLAMIATLLLLGFGAIARRIYRRDPRGPTVPLDPALQGIRGWLLLPALGVVLTPVRIVLEYGKDLSSYSAAHWNALTVPGGEAYHPAWAPLLLLELSAQMAIFVLSLLLLVMFFQRRRAVPLLYITMVVASAVLGGLVLGLLHVIPAAAGNVTLQDWGEVVRGLVVAMIWVPYFLVSRRVKSTFVRGLADQAAKAPEPPPLPAPASEALPEPLPAG